jgi:outer membrane protein TolC
LPKAFDIQEAVLMALENNRALRVERLNPPITRTFEDQERAAFDPILSAEAAAERAKSESRTGSDSRFNTTGGAAALTEFLPTGTEVAAGLTTDRSWGDLSMDQHATRAGLTVTQALLRGFGLGPNLADLRQARLDTRFSEYELRGFAEALVADVENAYWDYAVARRQLEIVEESLKVAQQQLDETQQRVRVGSLAETELAAAQAEVALRRESLINARSRVETLQVRLLRLVNPAVLAGSEREITPLSEPRIVEADQDPLQSHVDLALKMRPDLNQARLLVERGDLEIVKTKNGLLPKMDLFVSLGKTGYAGSFGDSVGDLPNDGYDVSAGLAFEFPVMNRGALARNQRAELSRIQAEEVLRNLEDLVREDIESAHIELRRSREQVDATAATRSLQEEKLRAETTKFRVGKSTGLLVAAAQRDLLVSQVSEVQAVANYLKALIAFHLLEGSLLERRGIAAPGGMPSM